MTLAIYGTGYFVDEVKNIIGQLPVPLLEDHADIFDT